MRYNKDAEANDMVHMGSDHRCVMATFTITTLGKSCHYKTIKGKHDIIKHECPNRKSIEVEKLEFEKRYPEIIDFFFKKKKTPPQKKQQRKQKVKMEKHKQQMRTQQQRKQKVKILKRRQKSKECAQEP